MTVYSIHLKTHANPIPFARPAVGKLEAPLCWEAIPARVSVVPEEYNTAAGACF